ncbi:MAG: trypsin-like peptidase domain-containing protein [Patescibacteria group bacterium]|nr:trypsin-like peptidase domain-containing protein [Patescibacteria group bacterium]
MIVLIVVLGTWSAVEKYSPFLPSLLKGETAIELPGERIKVITEESVVIDAVKKVGPSVITIAEEVQPRDIGTSIFRFGPFSVFGSPGQDQQQESLEPQNIGTGFIVTKDGFVVTNKHVVSDVGGKYQVVTHNDKKYTVKKIYRDPLNDIAILKIDPSENSGINLTPVTLGDSSKLQVGQGVIAIGTALGEFRNTVTTGVISGLGRGIDAGNAYQGYVERLDNVIQTDAAINPGNSGGPLLNSSAQVIGINTAVAQNGQNIGFALPINVVKESLKNFNETGQFERPYLGVSYKMISRDLALMNNVPQGAYIQTVVENTSADKAGIKPGDIIIKIDEERISDNSKELPGIINKKKVGQTIKIELWRNGKTTTLQAVLETAPGQ